MPLTHRCPPQSTPDRLRPFALKDAPALIEAVFPAQKVSVEAQRERKAGAGQTLTALGSYWKGRKPLILMRAIVLGSLRPQPYDPERDPAGFERRGDTEEKILSQRHKGTKKRRILSQRHKDTKKRRLMSFMLIAYGFSMI